MSAATRRLPRVLVAGAALGQPMGGVRRHNAELLPRVARLLAGGGGGLAVLEGSTPVAFELPEPIERLHSTVPAGPPLARAVHEGRALARALRDAADDGRPFDLVHTAHLPAPRRLPVPWSLLVHDLRSLQLAHTPFSRRFFAGKVIARAVADAACTITVSETVRRELVEGFHPRRLHVVPNAGDHLPRLPRERGPDAPLLCVGHIEPRKNLEVVLRALASDASLPRLVVAGAAKHAADETLRALAIELGVAARVELLGAVDDARLATLYARAACVVLPSRLEGFGIPVLEAQLARAPLAIADAGALPEVAGEGVPRFDPDDPAGCAAAIHSALRASRAEREEHAKRAGRFRWQASAELLVEAWREAVGRAPSA